MAKKEIEQSVADKLANLYKLQLLVSEIDRIRNLRGELPSEVEDIENGIQALQQKLTKFNEDIANCDRKITEMQAKIDEAESLIAQYSQQQEGVQNNKQYEFLSKEIEYQGLEIELANKRIRENLDMINNLNARIEGLQADITERQADLDVKKGELDEIIAETRNEEETLREKAKKIENNVDVKLLATFKRIHKKAHNGLAIVPIDNDACGGCFNKITAQRIIDVHMRKKIHTCEYCGRVLIDSDLADQNEMRRRRKGILSTL